MVKKIYKMQTTDGVRYSIGVFDNGEMLKASSPKYYKTFRRAKIALKKLQFD